MKHHLTRTETNAMVGLRLLTADRMRQANELQAQIEALEAERDAVVASVNGHAAEVLAGIAEDAGLDSIPMRHAFARSKDGTGTLEWEDPEGAREERALERPAVAGPVPPAEVDALHPNGEPMHESHAGPCNPTSAAQALAT